MTTRPLARTIVAAADASKILGIRAGAKSDHRYIGVWPIVVDGRLFVRSWTVTRGGWYQTFLDDPLGTIQVGAIHGRLLTAWSTAGVLGPMLVNYIREYEIAHGVAKADSYTTTMHIMAALLCAGLVCNLLIRRVDERYHAVDESALMPVAT